MKNRKQPFIQSREANQFDFFSANDSLHSFGKSEKSLNDSKGYERGGSREMRAQSDQILDGLNFTCPETGSFYRSENEAEQLCCKPYFIQNEVIKEPESIKYEFKHYKFPLINQKNEKIKKTICSFLNCKGGLIFIGIFENVVTKEHRAFGDTYNEAEKQQILKYLRKNAAYIQPEIILSQKMQISFVPVKFNFYPYSFIPGRFIIKIKIYPGSKEQIYTVRTEEGHLFVCMRTENQVLTYDPKKQFRKMLNIQKQRMKNNIDLSNSFYLHKCRKPEQGIRIFSGINKMLPNKFKPKLNKSFQKQLRLPIKRKVRLTSKSQQKSFSSSGSNQEQTNDRFSSEQRSNSKSNFEVLNEQKEQSNECNSDQSTTKRNINKKKLKRKTKKERKKAKKLSLEKQKKSKQKKQKQKKQQKIKSNLSISNKLQNSQGLEQVNQRQGSVSCERIIQRYYSCTKQNTSIINKIQYRNTVRKAQEIRLSFQDKNQKNKKELDNKSNCEKNKFENKRRGTKQTCKKLLALQKHMISCTRSQEQQSNFIYEILNINHMSHKIFAFSGFSKVRAQTIKRELINIGQNDYFQFGNLLIYKFSKQSNDNVLKQAISRSLKINYEQSKKKSLRYSNTNEKKKKTDMSFQYQQQNSQESSCYNSSMKNYRVVFKLTNRIKIMNYNEISKENRDNIKNVCLQIQKVSQRKKFASMIFYEEEKNGELPKVKQILFPNIYYSLLCYLELQKFNFNLLFY